MKHKLRVFTCSVFVFFLSFQVYSSNAGENPNSRSESTITAVTVYLDRAIVTRTISKRLYKGEHVLVFDNLPETLDQNSIQASGEGNATIRDVKFRKEFYEAVTDEDKRKLNKAEMVFEDSITDANDFISNAKKEQKMVQELVDKLMSRITVVSNNDKVPQPEIDIDEWTSMVTYYRTRLDELNKQVRSTERRIRILDEQLELVRTKRNSLGNQQEQAKNFVEVLVDVNAESNVVVNLSYMVFGPTWYPVYDLRVFSDTKKMRIVYQAMIQQNTTEDWNNVKMKLSTARANIGGQQPSLRPWYLNLYDNSSRQGLDYRRARDNEMAQMHNAMPVMKKAEVESDAEAPESLAISTATVEPGATAAVFVIPGRNTIKSDNQQHKVTIMMKDFDADFRYSTVPKLAPYAYLKAKVKNTTDFPIMAGTTNVFLDNNYVSTSSIGKVNPEQEFWTFLGIDEGIEVKYKTLKHYQKDEGIISKKNVYVFDYIIEITNNRKTEEEIVVWDQIPIANSEDIKVTLIEPDIEKEKSTVKMDDYMLIEWFYKLKPADKVKIPFKFTVESPKNKSLDGM